MNAKKEDNQEPQPVPIGTRLKLAREEKGMSLELVHEATKVPLDALRAIEEGYTVRTLSPFYYKGFVKIYGEYLGVEVADDVKVVKEEPVGQKLAQEYRQFFFRDLLSNIFTPRRIKQVGVFIGILFVFWLIFKLITGFMAGDKKEKKAIKKAKQVAVSQTVQVKKTEAPKKKDKPKLKPKPSPVSRPAPRVEPVQAVTQTPKITKNVTLTVRAKKESWLRVIADGQVVFQSTLELGAVETWLADEKIEIAGKNISQLEFELNGKLIGPLGRKDRKAKRVIITKDGLKVSK